MILSIDRDKLGKLFPFSFGLDTNMTLHVYGLSLHKILNKEQQVHFSEIASLYRPQHVPNDYHSLKSLVGQLVIFKLNNEKEMLLRGQLEIFEGSDQIIFLGSPWINNIGDLKANNLSFSDFANYDSLLDLLHMVQALEINNQDLKSLLDTIHDQHDQLQLAIQKTEEYALFPLQNPEPIIRIDLEGNVVLQNEAIELIGIIEFQGKEYTREDFWKFILKEVLIDRKDDFLEFISNGKTYLFSCRYIDTYQYYNLYGRDISLQKQQQHALEEAMKSVQAAAEAKDHFLTHMSHEIRTPLNGIIGMAGQLEQTTLDEHQRFYLDNLSAAADTLLLIISDILDLGKIESGEVVLTKSNFSLSQIIDRTIKTLHYKLEEKGLFLHKHHDHQLHDFYQGDSFRLNQILLNIVGNAIKFTESGSVEITTRLVEDFSNKQTLQIIIKDTGIGISPEFLKNIFDRFSQENLSMARKVGGTGLGMSITKELVTLMNGSIVIDSTPKQGTKVTIEFTLPKSSREATHKQEDYEISYDIDMLRQKIVLVVDDNQINRIVAKAMLSNNGIQVVEASSGAEALEYCKNKLPDVILMDLQMPELDGYQTTSIIRNNISTTVPIIALTANALHGEREKCIRHGMNDYLSKPFKVDQLLSCIYQAIGLNLHKS